MEKTVVSRPAGAVLDFASQVDIVIPFHGQYERVSRLVDSILKYTRSNWYRISLIDDGSENIDFGKEYNELKRPASHPPIRCIRSNDHRGFASACKLGFESTKYPWVCFVNSDCEIKDINWLKNLGACMAKLKSQNVKLIVPRTNNHVGGHDAQLGTKERKSDDVILDEGHVSLYCFFCHRQLFDRIGGFIKEYPYGWFEDQELAARMRKYGFRQAICGSSWIYHEGEATVKEIMRNNPSVQEAMMANRQNLMRDLAELK